MSKQSFEELYQKFLAALGGVVSTGLSPVQSLGLYLSVIREYIGLLRQRVIGCSFSVDQEIWLFKCLKPKFIAEKIFQLEVYALAMQKPVGTLETIRLYYEEELCAVQRFFRQHGYAYHYFRSGLCEWDHLYFVRGADISPLVVAEHMEVDDGFSTAMDFQFARFMAFERLQQYLLELICDPVCLPKTYDLHERRKGKRPLRWTGDTINLVEIGFSWYDTAQLNDGKATLVEIFEWMEEVLGVSIGKPHRRFDEIEGRKRISQTDYIDRMKAAILARIDRKNAYHPEKEELRRQRAERKRKLTEQKEAEKKQQNGDDEKKGNSNGA